MTLRDKEYITYQKQRYRSRERRLEPTFVEGVCVPAEDAEEEAPMAHEVDDEKEFGNLLLN